MKYLLPLAIVSFFMFSHPILADDAAAGDTATQLATAQADLEKATKEAEDFAKTYQEAAQKMAAQLQAEVAKYPDPTKMTPEQAQDLAKKQAEISASAGIDTAGLAAKQTALSAKVAELAAKVAELSQKEAAEEAAKAAKQ